MLKLITASLALGFAISSPALAETYEVHMLNRGEKGAMVFEPGSLQIAPGDTVKFVPVDPAHNAQSIKGMIPEGAEPFKGKINQEISINFDVEGLYGIKCLPHFAMGMVMSIAVGDINGTSEDFLQGRIPPRARKRFEEQLSDLQ